MTFLVRSHTVDITPRSEVVLAASGSREPTSEVAEPLTATFIELSDSSKTVLLVGLDLLYPGSAVRDMVLRSFPMRTQDEVIVAASHTHRGPMTDAAKPQLGAFDQTYANFLQNQIEAAAAEILSRKPVPSDISCGQGLAHHSVNRRLRKRIVVSRKPRFNSVVNAPNRRGGTDETLTILKGSGGSGELLFVIWNYACHPVGHPLHGAISAHYPHIVRRMIRERVGTDDVPVLFLQGFSGDTRPNATAHISRWRRRLRRFVVGPIFDDMTLSSYSTWSSSLGEVVIDVMTKKSDRCNGLLQTHRVEVDGAKFVAGAQRPVSAHGLAIGDDFALIGVSAEVVSAYGAIARSMTSQHVTATVGCIDQPVGYFPTEEMLQQGGYEAGGYCSKFSLEHVQPDIQQRTEHILRTIASARDKLDQNS